MADTSRDLTFGVELITFFEPSFWGVADRQALTERAASEPRWFWEKALASVQEAGLRGIEVCFPPGDWQSAVSAYGSRAAFRDALQASELELVSGFFDALEMSSDVLSRPEQDAITEAARAYAGFLSECGGQVLVAGMPVFDREAAAGRSFVDLEYVKAVSDLINRVGAVVAEQGIKLALHTEMGSVFCAKRDIDFFMLLTDPAFVGLCPDTAHITLAGSDPIEVLNAHHERVSVTHWKDAIGAFTTVIPPGENRHAYYSTYFRAVGAGAVDWATWVRRLREVGYQGWTILELDESGDPVADMVSARKFVEAAQRA